MYIYMTNAAHRVHAVLHACCGLTHFLLSNVASVNFKFTSCSGETFLTGFNCLYRFIFNLLVPFFKNLAQVVC